MLFIKRLLTALLLFTMFFTVAYVSALAVGKHHARAEAVAAVPANMRSYHQDHLAAHQAGEDFERQYKSIIGLSALGVSAALSLWLTFGGILAWCQERRFAPLPGNMRFGGGTESFRDYR